GLTLSNPRCFVWRLSIDPQGDGRAGPFVGGGGDPSRVVGAGKHLPPPHQQELGTLLTRGEAECDTSRRASSIKCKHQSGPLRCAAPESHPQKIGRAHV